MCATAKDCCHGKKLCEDDWSEPGFAFELLKKECEKGNPGQDEEFALVDFNKIPQMLR